MKQELIGKEAIICLGDREIYGEIIDETKNMIHLKTSDNKIKQFIKNSIKIKIGNKTLNGKTIAKRPEERIKACKKW